MFSLLRIDIHKMRFFKNKIIFLLWLIPVSILLFWLLSFKFKNNPYELNDGKYSIGNKVLSWDFYLTNGLFQNNILKNKITGEQLKFNGTDFSVKIGLKNSIGWIKNTNFVAHGASNAHIIVPENCIPLIFFKEKNKNNFIFYYKPLNLLLSIDYYFTKNDFLIHRKLSLINLNDDELVIEEVSLGNWDIDGYLSKGGKGLPVFINNKWFASGETPWLYSTAISNTLLLCHYPSAYLKKGESWSSDSVIIGGGFSDAKTTLSNYLRKVMLPPHFFTLYNTWYDLRERDLNSLNVITNFIQFSNKLMEFDCGIDYCVIDDGWFFKNSMYITNSNSFPNGLIEISDRIKSIGSKLGLWLSYSGLQLNNYELKKYNFEEAHSKYFCLSGTNYFTALSNRLTDLINNDHICFFKHDFNYFGCTQANHGHLRNLIHSEEVNMRQTAKLLCHERKINSNVIQAITTGVNLSPWWLKYAHILWMGGGDINFDTKYPATSRAEAEMTARDGKLYEILKESDTFFPLYALMTHGIIDGKLNSVGPWLNDTQWADYVMNYFGRGTAIREMYLFHEKLDKTKCEILARGINWANSHNDMMINSEMILGDPRKNEVYGFRGYDEKGKLYISLRNPSFYNQNISLKDIYVFSDYYCITYPYYKVCETKTIPSIMLPAESTMIIESLEQEDLKEPTIINARSTISDDGCDITVFFDSSSEIPVYLYSRKEPSGINSDKINEKMWLLEREQYSLNKNTKISPLVENERGFEFSINLSDTESVDIFITNYKKKYINKITDNGNEITTKYLSPFKQSNFEIITLTLSNGIHRVSVLCSEPKSQISPFDIQARIKYNIPSITIKISGSKSKFYKYNMPFPISQKIFNETINLNFNN